MIENRLENTLSRLYKSLAFLWKEYGFHFAYLASGYDRHPHEVMVGLENKACKLLFELDNGSSLKGVRCRMGTRLAWFSTPDYQYSALYGWYPFGAPYRADENTKTDLETLSQALWLHMDELLELLKEPKKIGEKLAGIRTPYGNSGRVENIQNNQTTPHGGTQ